ncbi:MAG: hypothetical protein HRT95_19210 [Moritella sp.]|uniref:hypothetical protein n=1 Tax=Moritella sp. TaxID=78556 RepID=UPI001DC94627|nr:hypothetical protein [Moritella sp.]NQZ52217.1 hypothetical protein [Moritella sp.]
MVIASDTIIGAKAALDGILAIQKTIYNYNDKPNINRNEIKKIGADQLSHDIFGFIDKLKTVVSNLEPIIPAAWASNEECNTLKLEKEKAKDELNTSLAKYRELENKYNIQDLVRAEVKESIKSIISEELGAIIPTTVTSCMGKDMEKIVSKAVEDNNIKTSIQSYADITSKQQKKLVEEVKTVTTTKEVVSQVCRQMDTDNIERQKRKLNIIISNVPEPTSVKPREKYDEDMKFVKETAGIPQEDFEAFYRAGKPRTDGKPRPIIIKMVDRECVDYWTINGKGYKLENVTGYNDQQCWINKDLCKADREAAFFVREERKLRMNQSSETQTPK